MRHLLFVLWLAIAADTLAADASIAPPTSAKRIITLSPHATELVYAAGAGNHLVGTVSFRDYPSDARRLPRVGDAARLDRERILSLHTDLVIAWTSGNRAEDLACIESQGIAVFRSDPAHLDDIATDMETIGRLAGTTATASIAARTFRERLGKLRHASTKNPLRVFYQLWDAPLMTLGGRHIVSELITLCGGRNLFEELAALSAEVEVEAAIRADPDVILAPVESDQQGDPFIRWRQWPEIDAVANGNLFTLPADLVHRPGPRLLDGAELLCGSLDSARERNHQ